MGIIITTKLQHQTVIYKEYVSSRNTFKKIEPEINDANFFENYNKISKKIEELMGINFERKPPFCNNITYTTKNKNTFTLFRRLSEHKNPKKRNIL